MKKSKKQKLKRMYFRITVICLVLLGIVFFVKSRQKVKNSELEQLEATNNEGPSNNQVEIPNKEEIVNHEEKPENSEDNINKEEENPLNNEEETNNTEEPENNDEVKIKENSEEINYAANPGEINVLVNKSNNLSDSYVPDDLVSLDDVPTVLSNPEVNQLREKAYVGLKELFAAAKDEAEYELYARSGYRSYNTQVALYNSYVSRNGQEAADKFSAKPGQSEHQTGLAMDITCEAMNFQLDYTFGDTEEGKWVKENANRFGFIVRYPEGKEDITGYLYEPWHIRYLGEELATKVYESGLTLEEYFEQQ